MIDPQLQALLTSQTEYEKTTLRLIASENYMSPEVREIQSSVLGNKYSEGYPGKRYYKGQLYTDQIEELAIKEAKNLFGADHVNVQPHSGSPANMAALLALGGPGCKILGMSLPHGGHLTHGWNASATGTLFDAHHYGVDKDTECLDYEAILDQAMEVKPDILICGASAYSRRIDFSIFREIANACGAYLLADMAHISGLVAAGLHMSPVPYADVVTTTTHKTLRGPRSGMILCKSEFAQMIDKSVFPGLQGGPHMNVIAALVQALKEAGRPEFVQYSRDVLDMSKALAKDFQDRGFKVVSGGTDNHMFTVDTMSRGMTGNQSANALEAAGIICNSNMIPFDERSPWSPSGIRIGTAAMTTRGLKPNHMSYIGILIAEAMLASKDPMGLKEVQRELSEFLEDFPVPM